MCKVSLSLTLNQKAFFFWTARRIMWKKTPGTYVIITLLEGCGKNRDNTRRLYYQGTSGSGVRLREVGEDGQTHKRVEFYAVCGMCHNLSRNQIW